LTVALLLPAATVASAALAVAAAPWGLDQPLLLFVFKPLATILILVHALMRGLDTPETRRWIVAGLVLSLVGDIALLWPYQGFLLWLAAFFIAHLCYLRAFTRRHRLAAPIQPFVVYLLGASLTLGLMWTELPVTLRWPVLAHAVCLVAMAAQAAVIWRAGQVRGDMLALGGALFVVSEALLAINRFIAPVPLASLAILGTYWAAQWCIASWLSPRAPGEPQAPRG
jgi:uncharacterized membrane protein YhhN